MVVLQTYQSTDRKTLNAKNVFQTRKKNRNQQLSENNTSQYLCHQIATIFLFIRSIEVSTPKLLGHWQSDIYGRNLVLDGCEGIRVYNLPIEIEDKVDDTEESEEAVVDDWEALADDVVSSKKPLTTVNIPDCFDLDFDLLKGYVPIKDGGNVIGLRHVPRDRTAGMRWLVKHHQKFKCDNRLFDIDFFAGRK